MQFSFETQSYFIPFAPWNIYDFPRFAHRGLLIDSSRHFEPVTTIMGVIDSVTDAKLNAIHWHLVDEQSFPFDSPSFPLLSEKGAYSNYERYTVDDVAAVVEYARQRGVRVMVEIGLTLDRIECAVDVMMPSLQTLLDTRKAGATDTLRSVHLLHARCR